MTHPRPHERKNAPYIQINRYQESVWSDSSNLAVGASHHEPCVEVGAREHVDCEQHPLCRTLCPNVHQNRGDSCGIRTTCPVERIYASPLGHPSIHGALVPHRRKDSCDWLPLLELEAWQLGWDTTARITLGQKTGCNNIGYPRKCDWQNWNMPSWMNKIKAGLS